MKPHSTSKPQSKREEKDSGNDATFRMDLVPLLVSVNLVLPPIPYAKYGPTSIWYRLPLVVSLFMPRRSGICKN